MFESLIKLEPHPPPPPSLPIPPTPPVLLSHTQRYYGKSLPFADESFNVPQIGLLTVEQALADYAVMITELKQQLAATDCPVIVFGGRWDLTVVHPCDPLYSSN